MSIQPNRVIARIVEQVDASDWPVLESRMVFSKDGLESLRLFSSPALERYATPLHFWVHALRDELRAGDHRADLVGAAGHALGRDQSLSCWWAELEAFSLPGRDAQGELWRRLEALRATPHTRAHRMLESPCRRSSVVGDGTCWVAHFWGHGGRDSWRRGVMR